MKCLYLLMRLAFVGTCLFVDEMRLFVYAFFDEMRLFVDDIF